MPGRARLRFLLSYKRFPSNLDYTRPNDLGRPLYVVRILQRQQHAAGYWRGICDENQRKRLSEASVQSVDDTSVASYSCE